jgi:hypothetical protein
MELAVESLNNVSRFVAAASTPIICDEELVLQQLARSAIACCKK